MARYDSMEDLVEHEIAPTLGDRGEGVDIDLLTDALVENELIVETGDGGYQLVRDADGEIPGYSDLLDQLT